MANGKRLLFFDILRIVSVALIVFAHIAAVYKREPFYGEHLVFNLVYLNLGIVGVSILVFVSGAVLEYTHANLRSINEIATFYVKRLFRIYPAFWMSLIIGVAVTPWLINRPWFTNFMEFSGFNTWSGHWGGLINPCGWFVGLIVALYFLFPFLSASIRKYPHMTLVLIALAEISLRYLFVDIPGAPDRWLPACNFLEFGLGIWVVQQNLFPAWTYDSPVIGFLADISFYAFLSHYVLLNVLPLSPAFYFIAVALFSWLMMLGDRTVQVWLKKGVGV